MSGGVGERGWEWVMAEALAWRSRGEEGIWGWSEGGSEGVGGGVSGYLSGGVSGVGE